MRRLAANQKGGTLVYVLVVLVVLSLTIAGMLQLSLMSVNTGRFEEQRRQALAAAESGIALAQAKLAAGVSIPRTVYPSLSASIDSAGANWIGPGTGLMPSELSLGTPTSFRVWVSEPAENRTIVKAEGRAGGRTRLVQVTLRPHGSNLRFLVSATSTQPWGITLNGSGNITGDMHTEGLTSDAVLTNGSLFADGALRVRPEANVEGIRNRVKEHFESVEVDPEEYEYPLPVSPAGLPYRGKLWANGWDPVNISQSGEYESFLINGSCDFNVDATAADVVIHVKDDFTINGSVKLNIIGSHSFRLYVDGDFTWNGSTKGAALEDPTKFVVCCSGDRVVVNGSPSLAAVIYAPGSDVVFNGHGAFTGVVVGRKITYNGSGNLVFPSGEYADKIRDLDLGVGNSPPVIEAGSWSEIAPGSN
ncbi:MAG: hypothetical protein VB144_03705 [Clostridia bacterium]|nr:hypothetical protein [Clostridia bacterium]